MFIFRIVNWWYIVFFKIHAFFVKTWVQLSIELHFYYWYKSINYVTLTIEKRIQTRTWEENIIFGTIPKKILELRKLSKGLFLIEKRYIQKGQVTQDGCTNIHKYYPFPYHTAVPNLFIGVFLDPEHFVKGSYNVAFFSCPVVSHFYSRCF